MNNYLKNPENYGKSKRCGRPKSTTARDDRLIFRKARWEKKSSSQIANEIPLNCNIRTVQRRLQNNSNMVWRKMAMKPPLTVKHKECRLNFAKEHLCWTFEWRNVIFSDEKKFNLDGPDGIRYYWHHLGDQKHLLSHRQHGGGCVMVWGAFCYTGQVGLAFISSRMNSVGYQDMLREHLLPMAPVIAGREWIFLQDNASIHRSHSTKNWFHDNNVISLDFPARSPDLNPIENLWAYLVRQIYANGQQYKTVANLRDSIVTVWNQTAQNYFQRLVDSMPERMYSVVYNHGAQTKY